MTSAITSTDDAGLTKAFGAIRAVDGIELDVAKGAVFGLLGPDGAGKSTLIRLLATVLAPDEGDVEIFGISLRRRPDEITPLLGYMPQKFSMYPDLTVAENINFFAKLRGVKKADRQLRSTRLLAQMGLANFAKRRAGRLSGGMKQKLMLASLLMHEPELLLLDEPTTGVDPVSRHEFWEVIDRLREDGKTTFVATPYMDEAERCTQIAFIAAGKLTHVGTPAQTKARVGGVLIEVTSENPRLTLQALEGSHSFTSTHLFGDAVRVLVPQERAGARRIQEVLLGSQLSYQLETIPMDMESAFAALAEPGRDDHLGGEL
ncbi:MAG: ABC transporter ATP-binding protein [Propionibacteriaceae bacterium]|jgi:ABC-2 type transport system ATP-binding protein|nr:ABC transporter ATP-binding protein [Propionibacteriaceae bacterium]